MKKLLIGTAVAASMGLAVSNASASVYAHSLLFIKDLTITFGDPTAVSIPNFNFDTQNTAVLNDVGAISTDSCSGQPINNSCNPVGAPVDATVVNAVGSAPLQGENAFALQGPGLNQYSWADSVVDAAELTNFVPTTTRQGNEAELQTGFQASGATNIQTTTALIFDFAVGAAGNTLTLDFMADPSLRAAVLNEPNGLFTSQAQQAISGQRVQGPVYQHAQVILSSRR